MKIPKYVQELMGRAEYNFTLPGKNPNAEVGYTVEIKKYSHYETADTFMGEINCFKK